MRHAENSQAGQFFHDILIYFYRGFAKMRGYRTIIGESRKAGVEKLYNSVVVLRRVAKAAD